MDTFNQIVWPEQPPLNDEKLWKRNVRVVRMLCQFGKITRWLKGKERKDIYTNMPYQYEVFGVKIEFLPHWGFIKVGGRDYSEIPGNLLRLLMLILSAKWEKRKKS